MKSRFGYPCQPTLIGNHVSSKPGQHLDMLKSIGLTSRECEVLDLVAQRLTNHQIASRLIIDIGTVKNHLHNILNKLDVKSRHEAAWCWYQTKSHLTHQSLTTMAPPSYD
jgi:DNA-binding NarL/FixJ family response regulator